MQMIYKAIGSCGCWILWLAPANTTNRNPLFLFSSAETKLNVEKEYMGTLNPPGQSQGFSNFNMPIC